MGLNDKINKDTYSSDGLLFQALYKYREINL